MRFFILVLAYVLISFFMNCSALAQENLSQAQPNEDNIESLRVDPLQKIAEFKDFVVVMELYSSQACVFCPKADAFMQQFTTAANVISFSCHVDYFDVKVGALSIPACSKRQEFYESVLREGPKFTPQMMINGIHSVVGYRHADVWKKLDLSLAQPPVSALQIVMTKVDGEYEMILPEVQHGEYSISLIEYNKEIKIKVAEGGNRGKNITYFNVVRSITEIGSWVGEKKIVSFDVKTPQEPSGFAIIVQNLKSGKIVAAGKYAFPKI